MCVARCVNLSITANTMKSLRVITGFHSGAQLDLSPGSITIGSARDDDIRITDWTGSAIELTVANDGVVQIRRSPDVESNESVVDTSEPETLADFVPVQFGDIVICVGPAHVDWPSDLTLLSMLFAKPTAENRPSERPRHRRWPAIAGVTTCCAALLTALSLLPSQPAKASSPVDFVAHIRSAVARVNVQGLAVERVDDDISITGMVAGYAEDARVRQVLADLGNPPVRRRYNIAENDVQNIRDALGIAGANVSYRGGGIFEVDGTVASLKTLDAAVARVRDDLTANVKDIVVSATEIPPPEVHQPIAQLISASAVKYTQSPDGVKQIYVSGS
ncbi:type III secretion protein D [Burkholderia pyrrocinia]|uniref:Type III secretion protein D n=2 Tax=Burkholderiaceae TaxID=119060 RepID=A0A318HTU5_BURPY|nr:type III secretion protein D [Burkholderia pyrrocinia]SFW89922.1 type III secretion protein D [Burkholderia sp. NFACC33-1]SFY46366.1 type III secretion protein D [Burkholderia sp. NFPP32]